MFGVPLVMLLVLLASLAVPVVLLLDALGRPSGPGPGRGIDGDVLDHGLRRHRRRLVGCLVGTVGALGAGLWLDGLWPSLLGVPLAVAPGLAAAVAMLAYATWPSVDPLWTGAAPVTASLTRREAWSFARRGTLLVPLAVAGAFLLVLVAAALVADPDASGRLRAFGLVQGDVGSLASPFPGSFYGLPLAAVTVLLVLSTYAALRRMATSPAIAGSAAAPGAHEIDRRWRAISTTVIVRTATSSLLGYAGSTLLIGGSAILRASRPDNGMVPTPWIGVGWTATVLGVLALLAAAVAAGAAVAALLSLRTTAVLGQRAVVAPRP